MPGAPHGAGDAPVEPLSHAISEAEFQALRALILRESGISLSHHKKALLVGRLSRRVRDLGLATFREYHERVRRDPDELREMLDRVATNETRFFREPRHFALLETEIFPRWAEEAAAGRRARRIRIWSAACSTGEETFSLAMVARARFPAEEGWDVEVIGTDISSRVLAAAANATWPIERAPGIPERHLKAFMLRGVGPEVAKMRATRELRSAVRFQRLNLADETSSMLGPFDVIFCCNVFIYFDAAVRARAVDRMLAALRPDGYLFLGNAESLSGMSGRLRYVAANVYTPLRDPT